MTWQNGDGGNNNGADTYYALSNDLETWTYKGALFARTGNQFQTNANVKLLKDGRLMAVSSFWNKDYYSKSGVDRNDAFPTDQAGQEANREQGIRIKFSSDNGVSWTSPKIVYNGPNWECHIMEPSAGHIQIYFAESRPRISDSHSGTSMIESKDNGVTWTPSLGNKAFRVIAPKGEAAMLANARSLRDAIKEAGVVTNLSCEARVGSGISIFFSLKIFF